DSLPALYLSFIGFYKNDGLCYINHISSVLKYLCNKNNATVLVTNLAIKNCDFTNNVKPAIGKYWFHIPNTRLMISTTTKQQQMYINVAKSVYLPLDEKCILSIHEHGVS
ncbi:PREDICTED: DNA repair protein RAD51 homolog 4-like, partial [Diuraphis noxia]|uniref:DNA repair protein RAD51 homolog 4-like n=1 Tax=Diuraphis noxia TaxID=143948 RepID=UPI00076392D6